MRLNKKISYVSTFIYLGLFFLFVCFSSIQPKIEPYAVAIYSSSLYLGASSILSSLLLIVTFLLIGGNQLLLPIVIVCSFFIVIRLVNKNFKTLSPLSVCAFTLISLIGYIFIGNLDSKSILSRLFSSLLTVALTYVFSISANAIKSKQ